MINCYVIEDEPLAMAKIKDYIAKVPYLRLVGSASNPLEISNSFAELDVKLVFSDILMPGMKGTDFLRAQRHPPAFIFISADPSFALESYELDVVDYIAKPYGFERFYRAVLKAAAQLLPTTSPAKKPEDGRIVVTVKGRSLIIHHSKIIYIQGAKDYVNIVTAEGHYLYQSTLVQLLEKELSPETFLQTERSYIANVEHIKFVGTQDIIMDTGDSIKLSATYRDALYLRMKIKVKERKQGSKGQ